ncbi:uncharacterized protein LOC130956701 [Arachis stenosperma]|uniref:uncharacterized protein LOC130956701 n=1 Tax=Arachis stenosperma TaxID=217475 RepID=UPI0025ACB8D2|nr:uncharacterized protein LOC130956701 [Arachis stenosperma]
MAWRVLTLPPFNGHSDGIVTGGAMVAAIAVAPWWNAICMAKIAGIFQFIMSTSTQALDSNAPTPASASPIVDAAPIGPTAHVRSNRVDPGRKYISTVEEGNTINTTSEKLFELLDDVVEKIGEYNIVQVITDNGSNYVLAGKLLMKKRPNLFWTPCAAHYLDLMLEDIGKLPLIQKTIKRTISLVSFTYSHSITLAMLRHFTNGKELVLRLVDGEKKPPIKYIYEAMEKAKECIMKTFLNDKSKYNDVFKIIDNRWNCQLHRPLYAAGHFLNPELFYENPRIELDLEVTKGWFECITRLVPSQAVQQKILEEQALYKAGYGLFGSDFAKSQRKKISPDDNTLSWNLVFEAMGGHEPTTNTRRQQNRKRKEPATARLDAKSGPSGSKASKKGKGKAVIVEEEKEPEFEDEEDSENEEEQEEEIQFNDTESYDDEGVEGHDNNRVNLDEFDES